MQRTFDELGIELLKYGYSKVVFIEVECKVDGTYRLGVSAELPIGDHFECPECHEQRPCSGILATGYSKRPLPLQPERWWGRGNWHCIDERPWQRPSAKLMRDVRARHYKKSRQVAVGELDHSHEASLVT
jgi:hypothetical protein